jgi:hypothetical protein
MEVPEYLTLVGIAIAMTFGAIGLFVGIMLRARVASWTDASPGLEQQLQDGQDNFQWPKGIRFMGKLPNCYRWMFIGLLVTITLALFGIYKVGHP